MNEKVIDEFKLFLDSILAEHAAKFKAERAPDKLKLLTEFTEDYNTRAIDRALVILGDTKVSGDKAALKDELATVILGYSNKFLKENFH